VVYILQSEARPIKAGCFDVFDMRWADENRWSKYRMMRVVLMERLPPFMAVEHRNALAERLSVNCEGTKVARSEAGCISKFFDRHQQKGTPEFQSSSGPLAAISRDPPLTG